MVDLIPFFEMVKESVWIFHTIEPYNRIDKSAKLSISVDLSMNSHALSSIGGKV